MQYCKRQKHSGQYTKTFFLDLSETMQGSIVYNSTCDPVGFPLFF